ncbi:MAG TPA: fibronectin type III domain-containing protein, partial [Burkholderiaceae bacterium]|nr:fibronectin type III domain-containing protein [Burkholderiaceae bacterium]
PAPNVVNARFVSAAEGYVVTSAPAVRNDAYVIEDGQERPLDLGDLQATTDPRNANYLMGIELERARPAMALAATIGHVGEDIRLLDTLAISITDGDAYASRTFEVRKLTDNWNGTFDVELFEIRPNAFALDADRFTPIDPIVAPDLSYLWSVASIVDLVADITPAQLMPDGTGASTITLSWALHSQAYVRQGGRIELRYRQVGYELWRGIPEVGGDATGTALTASLVATGAYEFQARARNGLGARSQWVSTIEVVDGEAVVTPSLRIQSNALAFHYDVNGDPSPNLITLTPVMGGPLTGPVTWTIVSGSATLGVSGDVRTIDPANMASDVLTLRAEAAYGASTYADLVTVFKVRDGLQGPPGTAKLLTLSQTSSIFRIAKDGSHTPAAITFEATGQNLTGPLSWGIVGGALTGSGSTRMLTLAGMTADTATVTATQDGQTDSVTVAKLREGTDAVQALMPNLSHSVPASATGVVSSYTGSGTTIRVYEGANALTFHTTLAPGRFTVGTPVVSPAGAITVGGRTGSGTDTCTVADHSAMSDAINVLTITYPVTARRADGTDVSLSLVQTITKSRAGVQGDSGPAAQLLRIEASAHVVHIDPIGARNPGTLTLTAQRQNVTGNPTWSLEDGTATLTPSGLTCTIDTSTISTDSITVKATLGSLTDRVTIHKVHDGAIGSDGLPALTPIIFNESHTVPASATGVVASYDGSGTQIRVLEGSTWLTYHTTLANGRFTIGTPTVSPASSIAVGARSGSGTTTAAVANHSGMSTSQDVVTITYPISVRRSNGDNVSLSLIQTITKSKSGAPGSDGADGADGLTIFLDPPVIQLPASATGAVTSYSGAQSTLVIFKGPIDDSSNGWTFSRVNGPGVTSTLSGNVLTVTGVATANDVSTVNVTATHASHGSITRVLRITKAKTGAAGSDGDTGPRGSIQLSASRSGTGWSDAIANTAIANAGAGVPRHLDMVTIYSTTTNWAEARAYLSGVWTTIAAYINGNLVVNGTIGAEKLGVDSLSAITADLGLVTAGVIDLAGGGAVGAWNWIRSGTGPTG